MKMKIHMIQRDQEMIQGTLKILKTRILKNHMSSKVICLRIVLIILILFQEFLELDLEIQMLCQLKEVEEELNNM